MYLSLKYFKSERLTKIKHHAYDNLFIWKDVVEDIFDGMGGKSTAKNKSDLNALVQSGDKRVTISAADVTTKPTTKDLVIISSVRHQIVDIKTQQAQGTDVSYELYVRN